MTEYPEFPESAVEHRGKCPECGGQLVYVEMMVRSTPIEDVFVSSRVPEDVVLLDCRHEEEEPTEEWIECGECGQRWEVASHYVTGDAEDYR